MSTHSRSYFLKETIAAVATAPGEGGIAVIRISGKEALPIAAKVYEGPLQSYASHTVHYGKILNASKEMIDEVLCIVMKGPRSYTGEDTVEIHCHGGSLVTRKVLDAILQAGAHAALPGEFTYQAYMNKKIDLAQAEAVQELIAAKNELALSAAEQQLQGSLSKKISSFQQELLDTAAILEAWVDFPEEGLEFATLDEVIASLEVTYSKMTELSDSFHEGKVIHEGLTLCLAGSPNVGKSSLMNALLGKERAIVTAIPGTTRDVLEGELRLSGLHFKLFDTAGIRQTEEIVEQEGIRRSKETMSKADIVLLVIDSQCGVTPEDAALITQAPSEKTILVWNKVDLPTKHIKPDNSVSISAK
jgi:tRNA modification GTPase